MNEGLPVYVRPTKRQPGVYRAEVKAPRHLKDAAKALGIKMSQQPFRTPELAHEWAVARLAHLEALIARRR